MMMSEAQVLANPFPGLRPFEMSESHLFFGREGHSDQLLRRLMRTRFASVVGVSGSGKSSLVRAGLLPLILSGFATTHEQSWRIAIMRPGVQPISNLASALAEVELSGSQDGERVADAIGRIEEGLNLSSRGLVNYVRQSLMPTGENLLVVVDQFEEIFRTLAISEKSDYFNQAAAFVTKLLEASRQTDVPIYIILTMRSDFLGDCDKFRDLAEAINEGQYLIPRLTRDEYRQTITGPIAAQRAAVEPRLINRLLNEVGDDSSMLPIFQHSLMRTWEYWAKHEGGQSSAPIDIQHYEAIGTMAHALSRQADEAYDELLDGQRKIAGKIFKGLTERGSDNREIRRPSTLKELSELAGTTIEEILQVIEVFRRQDRSFLTPPAPIPLDENSVVDISHESLIRNWQMLRDWVNEEADSHRMYLRIHDTAQLYREHKAALMRDPELSFALSWREKERPNYAWASRYAPNFDNAMSLIDESYKSYQMEAQETERRRRRRSVQSRGFIILLAMGFVISSGSAFYALRQKAEAERQRTFAVEARMEADEQRTRAEKKTEEALEAQRKLKEISDSTQMQLEKEKTNSRQMRKR